MKHERKSLNKLDATASVLSGLNAKKRTQQVILSHLIGAYYALKRATVIRHEVKNVDAGVGSQIAFQKTALSVLRKGTHPDQWLKGFYLNSAIMRLDFAGDKLSKLKKWDKEVRSKVLKEEIRKIKHTPDSIWPDGRSIDLSEAVTIFDELSVKLANLVQAEQ